MKTLYFNNKPIEQRAIKSFLARIDTGGDCHLWKGNVDPKGYPRTMLNRKATTAQRVRFIINGGEIPRGHVIRAKCNNRLCLNPDHLYLTTREKFE